MAKYILENIEDYKNIDYITPVPIHKNRMRTRGFNQSYILAKEISKYINIPVIPDLLLRTKNTKAQSGLTPIGRENNIKGAFVFNKNYNIYEKNIAIVDDIYTTGSTINECAKTLSYFRPKSIISITLSIVSNKNK